MADDDIPELTEEDVLKALRNGAEGANYLAESLRETFTLNGRSTNLVLDGGTFDAAERAAEKQAQRDRDQADIDSGKATAEEVRERNTFLKGELKVTRLPKF